MTLQGDIFEACRMRCLPGVGWEGWVTGQWVPIDIIIHEMTGPGVRAIERAFHIYGGTRFSGQCPAINSEAGATFTMYAMMEVK